MYNALTRVVVLVVAEDYVRHSQSRDWRLPEAFRETRAAANPWTNHILLQCCIWMKWKLAMCEFDHPEIRSVESVNGAKTGP